MMVRTSDIVLASTLRVLGYQLADLTLEGVKGTFVFTDVPDSILRDYDLGKLRVEPVSFNQAIRTLTTACRRGS